MFAPYIEEKPLVEMFLGGQGRYSNVESSERNHFEQSLQKKTFIKSVLIHTR